jgi:putative endonuclease
MNPALPETYYVYLLRSYRGEHLYIGCTNNLEKRIEEHKTGKVVSTKRYLPMDLIYCETYISKSDAFNREKALKKYGSGLVKLKMRLKGTLQKGRAG